MFLRIQNSGYRDTEQFATGLFMAVFSKGRELWAVAKKVKLSQCGCWMMGSMNLGGKSVCLSGPLGGDGLPCDWEKLPPAWQEDPVRHMVQLPADLAEMYWKCDDGHNHCGSATTPLRDWGTKTFVKEKR